MKWIFGLSLVLVVVTAPRLASAQGTPECYATFPGAKGKACCDASYRRNARGSLPNSTRMAELQACVAGGKKKS